MWVVPYVLVLGGIAFSLWAAKWLQQNPDGNGRVPRAIFAFVAFATSVYVAKRVFDFDGLLLVAAMMVGFIAGAAPARWTEQ